MLYMRAVPGKMRTDEVYVAAFGPITFISIGVNASNGWCVDAVSSTWAIGE